MRDTRRHDFPGAWDPDFVRTGLAVSNVLVTENGVQAELKNLAGHSFPTADPSRVLELTALDSDGMTIGNLRLLRKVPLPRLRDDGDTVLRPGETRLVSIPTDGTPDQLVIQFLQLGVLPADIDPSIRDMHQQAIEVFRQSL
jgi:hypothetical protein